METKVEIVRETKFLQARNDYGLNARLGYPRIMDETDRQICDAFEAGVKWSDEHPKPNLVDIDKATEWLKNRTMSDLCLSIDNKPLVNEFIESFKKAMMEE